MNYKRPALALLFFSLLYFFPQNIFSDNIEKANQYYEKYDYKYALDLYEKIMVKKPTLEVAQKLANCYRFINDTKGAEKAYAKVFTFKGFDPINYKYYADALKQNGKFEAAKQNYLLYGERVPAKAEFASKMANGCDAARIWVENPDKTIRLENLPALNSEYSDFSPLAVDQSLIFVSDRWFTGSPDAKRKDVIYGWTGNPYLKIYQTSLGSPGTISAMPAPVNGMYHNGSATFSSKGDTIYYTRIDLPASRKRENLVVVKKAIYMSVKKGNNWSNPDQVIGNSTDYSVQHPALSPDGQILYFASDMAGGMGGMDIYAAKRKPNGGWDKPKNCGPNINTEEDDVFPYVRNDGKFFYSTKGNIGIGGLDIFSASGSYDNFTIAENLKAPFNTSKDDFGIMYLDTMNGFLSSNREGGKGLDDIYRFTTIPAEPSSVTSQKPMFAIDGQVLEKGTNLPINNVRIILTNKTTGKESVTVSDNRGAFHFDLEEETDYLVSGDKSKYYLQQEGQITTKGLKESTIFTINFELERSTDAYLVKLNNIYYNFNKWDIRKDAIPDLTKVVNFMNSMPNVNIQLRSHTDARGPAVYNQYLSQKRAESAVDYLKNKGVPSQRMGAIGLGESELLNKCRDGVKCSKQEHQMNRRTEFKVVKVEPVLTMASTKVFASARK